MCLEAKILQRLKTLHLVSGESGIDVFQREAEKRNICIAVAEKVPSDANGKKFEEVKLMKTGRNDGLLS